MNRAPNTRKTSREQSRLSSLAVTLDRVRALLPEGATALRITTGHKWGRTKAVIRWKCGHETEVATTSIFTRNTKGCFSCKQSRPTFVFREYYRRNRARILERSKQYKSANKEKVRKAQRRRYNANRDEMNAYQRKWRRKNPTKRLEIQRRWRGKHPESARQFGREWRAANTKRSAELARNYRRRNPEQAKATAVAVRHRRRVASTESFTAKEWTSLKRKYGNRCLACGKHERTLRRLGRVLAPDHVHPLAHQGRNHISNIQPLCHGAAGCNNRKYVQHTDYRPRRKY